VRLQSARASMLARRAWSVVSGVRNASAIETCRPPDLKQEKDAHCLRLSSFPSYSQVTAAAKTFTHKYASGFCSSTTSE
jgi:hypothetical protein